MNQWRAGRGGVSADERMGGGVRTGGGVGGISSHGWRDRISAGELTD